MSLFYFLSIIILPAVFALSCHTRWHLQINEIKSDCSFSGGKYCEFYFKVNSSTVDSGSIYLDKNKANYDSSDPRLKVVLPIGAAKENEKDKLKLFICNNDGWFSDSQLCETEVLQSSQSASGTCKSTTKSKMSFVAKFDYHTQKCCDKDEAQSSCVEKLMNSANVPIVSQTKSATNKRRTTTTVASPVSPQVIVSKDSMVLIISIAGAVLILLFSIVVAFVMIRKYIKKKVKGKGKRSEQMLSMKSRKKKKDSWIKSRVRSLKSVVSRKKSKGSLKKSRSVSEKKSVSKSKMRTGTDLTSGDSTQKSTPSNSDYDVVRPNYLLLSNSYN